MAYTTYEDIASLSEKMVAAARAGDWDGLFTICRELTGCISKLESGASRAINTQERRSQIEVLMRILADDAVIRDLQNPSLKELDRL